MRATGASNAATGSIAANTDSTLTLTPPARCVLISNLSGAPFYVRLNAEVSDTVYDFVVQHGERAWITDVVVETVHVYGNAVAGVRVVGW